MTKEEEIQAAYEEREAQELEKLAKVLEGIERESQAKEDYEQFLAELEMNKPIDESLDEDYSPLENEEEEEIPPHKQGSSIDYEALTMNAIMGGYGDVLGFD